MHDSQRRPVTWTIAASDSSGGAGIQADLGTFFDLGTHGCSVITAITAQNSREVRQVTPTRPDALNGQLDALRAELHPAAIKIGVIPTRDCLEVLSARLPAIDSFKVWDPVLGSTSGAVLCEPEAVAGLHALFPHVDLITPNIPEAAQLAGVRIEGTGEQAAVAETLRRMGAKAVLVKGGHGPGKLCQDYYTDGNDAFWLSHARQASSHTRGTGCTLSSAIAAYVARGKSLRDAVVLAHAYVQQGIRLGHPLTDEPESRGPLAHAGQPTAYTDFPQVSEDPAAVDLPSFPDCGTRNLGLYVIVPGVEWMEKLLPLGVKTIQLRIKDRTRAELDPLIERASRLGRRFDARLFINDHWELAIKHRAYGVHLGQEDVGDADLSAIREAGLRLGLSTHSEFEWARAATLRPSYLALGTVFPTRTKPAIVVGLENLCEWARILKEHFPLCAIGGIKLHHMEAVLRSGVGSVAVVTAITEAPDYRDATEQFKAALAAHQIP